MQAANEGVFHLNTTNDETNKDALAPCQRAHNLSALKFAPQVLIQDGNKKGVMVF